MRALRSPRDERGATAVLVALLSTVLFGVGALTVDIGQAYAKKSLEQTDVDTAVMAAAAELTQDTGCNQAVVDKATEYLQKDDNAVSGQATDPATGKVKVDLTNGDPADGEITCPGNWKVELRAPYSRADFSLAGVLPGAPSGVDLDAFAAAQIKAAKGAATLPFFAVQGCDKGQQSIRNDSGPQIQIPPLAPDSQQHSNASFTITPETVDSGTTSATITVTGTQLGDVTAVGFTGAAGPPYHYVVPVTTPSTNQTTSFTVAVPSGVLAVDDTWYVRMLSGTKWSKQSGAQRFSVGPPKLYCDNSLEGNFGTIDIPRSDTNSFPLQWNMIKGVEPTLAIHPAPNGECSGQPLSVESKTSPVSGTNCIATEPGLKIAETNEGMVTGKADSRAGWMPTRRAAAARYGDSSRTSATVKGFHVNDDVLTCFITNGASVQDLVDGTTTGNEALSSAIFDSPRFFWIPVLDTDPSTGKKSWPIIDFRPGFISDQSMTATHAAPGTISALDGLNTDSQGISEVKVILLDKSALPEFAPTVGGEATTRLRPQGPGHGPVTGRA